MYLYQSRLQETSMWLDEEWQAWKDTPAFKDMSEEQLMETFLTVMMAVGSSIDRAYIEAWHENQKYPQKDGGKKPETTCPEMDNVE